MLSRIFGARGFGNEVTKKVEDYLLAGVVRLYDSFMGGHYAPLKRRNAAVGAALLRDQANVAQKRKLTYEDEQERPQHA